MQDITAEDQGAIQLYMEQRRPIYHTPVALGINEFKNIVRRTGFNKTTANKLIRAFKKRAWMEFDGIARGRGTTPTHRVYGKKVKVNLDETTESGVKVKSGTK